jgi:hypothetical protein
MALNEKGQDMVDPISPSSTEEKPWASNVDKTKEQDVEAQSNRSHKSSSSEQLPCPESNETVIGEAEVPMHIPPDGGWLAWSQVLAVHLVS